MLLRVSGKFCSLSWRDRVCELGKSLAWRSRIWRPDSFECAVESGRAEQSRQRRREGSELCLSSPLSFRCCAGISREELQEECFKPPAESHTPGITCGAS